MAALYKPLSENDNKKISSIIIAANVFFRKIAKVFLVYLVFISLIYPFIVKTNLSYEYVCSLSFILGINLFIQYYFAITWKLFLQADNRVVISAGIQIICIVLNTVLTIVTIKVFSSIHFVKLISSFSFFLQSFLYDKYINKNYSLIMSEKPNEEALKHRWDGFGINLAAFLNANTDIIVLTFLSSLQNVSIYGVYSLVVTGIKSLITSISAGIIPNLGREYALQNKKGLEEVFFKYENIIFYFTFSIYTCAVILIVPFIKIYTNGIIDANYIQPQFSFLLILSYSVFCLREPYVNMAYASNHFKEISKYCYIEAILNVILSFFFVKKYGLQGVAFGTFISMSYRTMMQVFFLKNHVLFRSPIYFFAKIIIFLFFSFISFKIAIIANKLETIVGWRDWIICSVFVSIIVFSINFICMAIIKCIERKIK